MDLIAAEHFLQQAQRDADVDALDELLHPAVVAMGPDGAVFSKQDDLDSYRSGALRVTRLVEEDLAVQQDGTTGVTRLLAAVDAVQAGTPVSARLRYTRLWVGGDGRWQVLAAVLAPA